jgi:hypothetical protein
MLHLLLAGTILMSGSQTTATSSGRTFHVAAQIQHVSARPPVNALAARLRMNEPRSCSHSFQVPTANGVVHYTVQYFADPKGACTLPAVGVPGLLYF